MKFERPRTGTTGKTGKRHTGVQVSPGFRAARATPDADNIYLPPASTTLHTLHNPAEEQNDNPGCTGSAVDLTDESMKDVGPPAPVTPAGAFLDEDNSVIEISWTPPAAFIKNGRPSGVPPREPSAQAPTSTGAGRAGTRRGQPRWPRP